MTIEWISKIQFSEPGSGDFAVQLVKAGRKQNLVVQTNAILDDHSECLDYTPLWNHPFENSRLGRFVREQQLRHDVNRALKNGNPVSVTCAKLSADQMPR